MLHILPLLVLSAGFAPASQGVEISSPEVSATVKSEADLKEIGLPVYPGSRLRTDSKDGAEATLGFWVSEKGFRLVVVKYESNDEPAKILAFYRKALPKFGPVLQCPGGGPTATGLSCEGHESKDGDVDLMAGSKETRRIVSVEAGAHGPTRYELVYLRARGVDAH